MDVLELNKEELVKQAELEGVETPMDEESVEGVGFGCSMTAQGVCNK